MGTTGRHGAGPAGRDGCPGGRCQQLRHQGARLPDEEGVERRRAVLHGLVDPPDAVPGADARQCGCAAGHDRRDAARSRSLHRVRFFPRTGGRKAARGCSRAGGPAGPFPLEPRWPGVACGRRTGRSGRPGGAHRAAASARSHAGSRRPRPRIRAVSVCSRHACPRCNRGGQHRLHDVSQAFSLEAAGMGPGGGGAPARDACPDAVAGAGSAGRCNGRAGGRGGGRGHGAGAAGAVADAAPQDRSDQRRGISGTLQL